MNQKIHAAVFSFLAFSFFLASTAEAKVLIGPGKTELLIKPGKTGSAVFTVTNETDQDMKISLEAVNWPPDVHVPSHMYVYEWMDFTDYREFVVTKRTFAKLSVDVKAPKDLEGELIAQVFFNYTPVEPTEEQIAQEKQVGTRIGALVCLAAKGKEKLEATLALDGATVTAIKDGKANVDFSYTVENKGNIHVTPRGFIRLKKGSETVAESEVGVIQGLYVGETRNYHSYLQEISLSPGEYTAELDLKMLSFGKEKRMKGVQAISVGK